MKKIKVYLQYPWKFPDSPYYKYLLDNPSESVEYIFEKPQKGVITSKRFFWVSNFLKRWVRRIVNLMKFPVLNSHLSPRENYGLIHCAHCLSKNDFPWVADFESLWQIWVNGIEGKTPFGIKKAKKILMDKNCKKIVVWTERTKREFDSVFPEIRKKVEVVYPGVPLPSIKRKKSGEGIVLSFVARYFYQKGGLDVLRVFDYLSKKFDNVECIVVSEVPDKVREKYSLNEKIKFLKLMPQKELYEDVLSKTDIFVYPGYSDTFGFSITEAMSFGIPTVSVEGRSREEIISEGKTGFIVPLNKKYHWKELEFTEKEDVINLLIVRTEKLIRDKKLREEMSKNSLREVKSGRFSIEKRNEKLKKIYLDSIL